MAKTTARKWVKAFFMLLSFIVVFLFLITCLTPWLNPSVFWWIGFCGIIAPHLLVLLLFSFLFWLIVKPKLALIPLVALCIGYQQISVLFAYNSKDKMNKNRSLKDLRIVSWNIQSFNGLNETKTLRKHVKTDIVKSIREYDPDIVCLQEFNSAVGDANNIGLFKDRYPYYFFSKDYTRKNNYYSGCIVFSKLPIIDSGKIKYPIAESLIYVDVKKGNDTIRVFTTHLQSFKFKKADYEDIEKIKQQDEDVFPASKNIVQKMKIAFQRRGKQALIVKKEIDKSPFPSVICGDFNDVPNSYTYFHIRSNNRSDAFLKKGFGIGRTFLALALTLRIDYILPDKDFAVNKFDLVDEGLSDHSMLVADLSLHKL
ncbi:MAG: endonuclease/exonuclease/phosphatase family protein [Sphingobacteriia bacterium]|nr:endonuclease/exonuclease/phosphatase family protein [Sphingobacteriia bacterium]